MFFLHLSLCLRLYRHLHLLPRLVFFTLPLQQNLLSVDTNLASITSIVLLRLHLALINDIRSIFLLHQPLHLLVRTLPIFLHLRLLVKTMAIFLRILLLI